MFYYILYDIVVYEGLVFFGYFSNNLEFLMFWIFMSLFVFILKLRKLDVCVFCIVLFILNWFFLSWINLFINVELLKLVVILKFIFIFVDCFFLIELYLIYKDGL